MVSVRPSTFSVPNTRRASLWVSTTLLAWASAVRGSPAANGNWRTSKKRPSTQQHVLGRERFGAAPDHRLGAERVDHALDLREIGLEPLAGDVGGHLQVGFLAGLLGSVMGLELVGVLRIGEPLVVGRLVADVEEQHQAGGEADRQAEDVDEGIGLVLDQRPDARPSCNCATSSAPLASPLPLRGGVARVGPRAGGAHPHPDPLPRGRGRSFTPRGGARRGCGRRAC